MSVSQSVCPHGKIKLGSHSTDFHQIWYLRIFRKSVQKIQVSLKSDKNNRYFTWRLMYTYDTAVSHWIVLGMRNISDTPCTENQKTLFSSITFIFFKSYRLWDNVEKYGWAKQATESNIIQRMLFSSWIIKDTDTHSEYVIYTVFPLQQWLHELASLLRLHVHCLSCTD